VARLLSQLSQGGAVLMALALDVLIAWGVAVCPMVGHIS